MRRQFNLSLFTHPFFCSCNRITFREGFETLFSLVSKSRIWLRIYTFDRSCCNYKAEWGELLTKSLQKRGRKALHAQFRAIEFALFKQALFSLKKFLWLLFVNSLCTHQLAIARAIHIQHLIRFCHGNKTLKCCRFQIQGSFVARN